MKVYVIEKGYYSDKYIVGVVDSKEKAMYICETLFSNQSDITINEFDTESFQVKQRLCFLVSEGYNWSAELMSCNSIFYGVYAENTIIPCSSEYVVYAESANQAIKIAQDMKMQAMAEENGI